MRPVNPPLSPLDRAVIRAITDQIEETPMPVTSKAQLGKMARAAKGQEPSIPPSVGKEFLDASKGKTKDLPAHVKPKRK